MKETSMKNKNLGYWIPTVLIALAFLFGGFADLLHVADVAVSMNRLGYPLYFMDILGVWKLLGAVVLLAPGVPRLKEWAYAGMFFDLTGASLSHFFVGDAISDVLTPLVLTAVLMASWWLRPEGRKLSA
jgi:DoxX-like family